MIREHILQQNGDVNPLANYLMFYAPMTYGDLTDHIGGSTGVAVNDHKSDNLSWDSSVGAYIVNANTFRENPIVWSTPNRKAMWNDSNEWTQIYDIRKIENCIYGVQSGYANPNTSSFDYNNGFSFSHLYNYQSYLSTAIFKNVAIAYDYNALKANIYIDGVYIGQNNWGGQNLAYTKADGSFQRVSFGSSAGGNYTTHGYVKNIMLFNKTLSQQEIQDIINHNITF